MISSRDLRTERSKHFEKLKTSSLDTDDKEVLIVGGGFSGLVLARALAKAGRTVRVLEKRDRFGGVIQTQSTDGCLWEQAANGLLWCEPVALLFEDLQIEPITLPRSGRRRFIETVNGRLTQWPLGAVATLGFVVRLIPFLFERVLLKMRLSQKWLHRRPLEHETVAEFAERLFGAGFAQNIATVATQGIYAESGDKLSAQLVLGKFWDRSISSPSPVNSVEPWSQKRIRGTVFPAQGMSQLIEGLVDWLKEAGVQLETSVQEHSVVDRVKSHIDQGGQVVLCCGARGASTILAQVVPDDPRVNWLLSVEYVPVALIHRLCRKRWQKKLEGFGALLRPKSSENERFRLLGILQNSIIFPNRKSHGGLYSETWIAKGCVGEDGGECLSHSAWTALGEQVDAASRRLNGGVDLQCEQSEFRFWPETIPRYDRHLQSLQHELWAQQQAVFIFGNYLGEIGLSGLLRNADRIVEQMQTQKPTITR